MQTFLTKVIHYWVLDIGKEYKLTGKITYLTMLFMSDTDTPIICILNILIYKQKLYLLHIYH